MYILVTFVQSEDFIELVLILHPIITKNFLNLKFKFVLGRFFPLWDKETFHKIAQNLI